jgi:hypothetical protein
MADTTVSHTHLRHALIKFSATLVGLIAVIGIMSLFSIWSMNRAYIQGDREAEDIRLLADEAMLAQIDFKVQVQEWKNILLRGNEPVARARYFDAFAAREAGVSNHLANLAAKAAEIEFGEYQRRAQALLARHQALAKTYRDALEDTPDLSMDVARRIDKMVMGVDRDLENEISKLSHDILKHNTARRVSLIEKLSGRYETLRSVLLGIIVFSLGIIAINLYGSLRAARD